MIRIISKVNCERCDKVKEFFTSNQLEFEEEKAEDKGYAYWRQVIQHSTGEIGFPFLMMFNEDGHIKKSVNGEFTHIINTVLEWLGAKKESTDTPEPGNIKYDWGFWPEEGAPLPRE